MPAPSPADPADLRAQIIGLEERALRKSYYPQLQQQVEALRAMLAELEATRRRAEESEENYRELFDKSGEAIIVHAPDSDCIYAVNQAFTELYGYSHEEAVKLTIMQLTSPAMHADHATLMQHTGQAMEHGICRFEWLARRKDGSDFDADVTLKSATIRGERRILATVRDVTARKRAEAELAAINRQLEARVASRTHELATMLSHLQATQNQLVQSEKLASLGALVAGIAHELNTPIGNSLMVASTLQDQRQEFLQEIARGLHRSTLDAFVENIGIGYDSLLHNLYRASELVTNFKELAVDQTSSRRRRFALHEIVHEIEVAQAPAVRRAGCAFHSDIPADIVLDSFPGPLSQIISNLTSNAITHGLDGIPAGEIRICATRLADQRIQLDFADNGRGIPAENLPRIFDPFFTTKLGRGGSGLGLHIVYNLVTGALGGSIEVTSRPGEGAHFCIRLPATAPTNPIDNDSAA